MNPQHFLFSEASVLAKGGATMKRPMDEMEIHASSPQEDEFALLGLGARSPYEALLMPAILPEALKLVDPRDLAPQEQQRWREVFLNFLAGVSVRGLGKPMILKSPTHGARVDTLRELLPDARYLVIVRDPVTNFESVIRMWRKMFETYAIGPIPPDDAIREAVLGDRPCFESKLAAGTADLPKNRFAAITYESLVSNPVGVIERLYQQLELGDFEPARAAITAEVARRSGYKAKGSLPSPQWLERINREWATVLADHSKVQERARSVQPKRFDGDLKVRPFQSAAKRSRISLSQGGEQRRDTGTEKKDETGSRRWSPRAAGLLTYCGVLAWPALRAQLRAQCCSTPEGWDLPWEPAV